MPVGAEGAAAEALGGVALGGVRDGGELEAGAERRRQAARDSARRGDHGDHQQDAADGGGEDPRINSAR